MAEEATTTPPEAEVTTPPEPETPDVEKQAFLDRLGKESAKRKAIEKELADTRRQLEERETAGLPELEQLKKRLEKAEKDAETRVEEAREEAKARAKAERQVLAAAARVGFDDPDDVFRFGEFVDVESIDSPEAAERAVKRLAKAKPKLLKDSGEPTLPGKVLKDGRPNEEKRGNGFDVSAEAQMLAEGLKQFASKE